MSADMPIALITEANRGIRLEVYRQLGQHGYSVILGTRDLARGQQAAAKLTQGSGKIIPQQLDVTDPYSIERLCVVVEAEYGCLDILVNNAAILYDS